LNDLCYNARTLTVARQVTFDYLPGELWSAEGGLRASTAAKETSFDDDGDLHWPVSQQSLTAWMPWGEWGIPAALFCSVGGRARGIITVPDSW